MKNYFSILTYSFVILLTAIAASYQSQEKNEITTSDKIEAPVQIGEYVVATFEDTKGNLWFGTLEKGVAKYDGKEFENYYVPKSIMSIRKDRKGNIWMGCAGGLYYLNSKGVVNVSTNGPRN